MILAILVIAIFYLLAILIRNREKLKTNLKLERIKADKDRELDAMKLKFYSNISHEFRTPLTLILGPVENIIKEKIDTTEAKSQLKIIRKNAERLLRLINQLLDLSKIESGYMKLSVKRGDIINFIGNIAETFNYRAEKLNIGYKQDFETTEFICWFDPDKIEKILYNLLSNAFKYAGEGGDVKLEVSFNQRNEPKEGLIMDNLVLKVLDNGIGISSEDLNKIFNQFYQADSDEENNPGTGIGLTLTKQLTEIHKGTIDVESEQGRGSVFTVQIPVSRGGYSENEIDRKEIPVNLVFKTEEIDNERCQQKDLNREENEDSATLLIIDDDPDIRDYIHGQLRNNYNIHTAANGLEGFEKISNKMPDIILCDVMMPEMNGFELCKKLKSSDELKHIPILLLTAKTGVENKLLGLAAGADDYILKPFYIEEVKLKIKNILEHRRNDNIRRIIKLSPSEVEITLPDEKFIKKALKIVENYIDDSEFSIKRFSQEMGTSRMQLYRKIDALTNQTVKEFIRDIRLERASQLLRKKAFTVNEIAYMVGFREISYFRKCFKEKYGLTPTDYIAKNVKA